MAKKVLPPLNIDLRSWFRRALRKEVKKDKKLVFGLGTIGVGILGNEPMLSALELESDLEFSREIGVKRAVIFRLGGLSQEHASIISKFAT
jgi:hypothetical protein